MQARREVALASRVRDGRARADRLPARRRALGAHDAAPCRHRGQRLERQTTPPTQFSGAITALTDTSISLHDGNRDLTCAIDSTSPSVAALKVGMHVNVSCAGGTLASWAPIASGRAYKGKISAISDASVSVLYAGGTATCTVGTGSPSRDGFAVGDYVLMGCSIPAGQLVLLRHLTGDSGGLRRHGSDRHARASIRRPRARSPRSPMAR